MNQNWRLAGHPISVKLRVPQHLISDMKKLCISMALIAYSISASAISQEAASVKKPYNLIVWADLSFDENSQLTQITIPEKDSLPAPFVAFVSNSIANGTLTKPENAAANKQLESGLKVIIEIDPATSKARVLSQDLMPRPTRAEQQSEPVFRVKGEWSGRLLVSCSITASGRCSKPKIDQSTNAPSELPKILSATIGSWRFVPQKRAGKAVEGDFTTWVTVEADSSMPPEEFGKHL